MNIFLLDFNPKRAAKMHNNAHVVKMIIELAQILSVAHHVLNPDDHRNEGLYKKTHVNHPCAVWIRQSDKNYKFTYFLFKHLCKEYTFRYGKVHLTEKKLLNKLSRLPKNIPVTDKITKPALAMPDEFKSKCAVKSYRDYYIGDKQKIAKWTKRETPSWFIKKEQIN